jgi:hypothetical protein
VHDASLPLWRRICGLEPAPIAIWAKRTPCAKKHSDAAHSCPTGPATERTARAPEAALRLNHKQRNRLKFSLLDRYWGLLTCSARAAACSSRSPQHRSGGRGGPGRRYPHGRARRRRCSPWGFANELPGHVARTGPGRPGRQRAPAGVGAGSNDSSTPRTQPRQAFAQQAVEGRFAQTALALQLAQHGFHLTFAKAKVAQSRKDLGMGLEHL